MKLKKLFLTVAALAAFAFTAAAQEEGSYTLMPLQGGATGIPALSTNVFISYGATNTYSAPPVFTNAATVLVQPCNEYDNVGLTIAMTGQTGCNVNVIIYGSTDIFNFLPKFQYLNIGAGNYITNLDLDTHGMTSLAVVVQNTGTGYATNALVRFTLKSPKYGAKPVTE